MFLLDGNAEREREGGKKQPKKFHQAYILLQKSKAQRKQGKVDGDSDNNERISEFSAITIPRLQRCSLLDGIVVSITITLIKASVLKVAGKEKCVRGGPFV